ncbi:type VI secretion system lipoprotein TssJ [Celerinatantimonas sp. YJH-8]|uniref:type VI secretion system lipoprotein TssJ n=1 Tax=Celerinatantimonas sp. YJH-8 TaxID=3228714 RepID=UPI0038C588E0
MRRVFIILCGLLLLGGCSFGSSDDKIDYASLPSTVTFSLAATDDVNPNATDGTATPIQVRVFELEDDSMLKAADYEQLANHYKKALKSNYVDDYDYMLTPGQFKFVDPIQLDDDTRYIGVMASYSDPDKSQWKKVVKVKPLGHEYHLLILLKSNDVVVEKVE